MPLQCNGLISVADICGINGLNIGFLPPARELHELANLAVVGSVPYNNRANPSLFDWYCYPPTPGFLCNIDGGSAQATTTPIFLVVFQLTAGEITSTSLSFSWDLVANSTRGVIGYKIFRNGSLINTVSATTGNYTDSTVTPSTAYTYMVEAYKSGNSADSNTITMETFSNIPTCPNQVLVFQICNSNSQKDDNFDIILNGTSIGIIDLNSNSQVGGIFIGDTNPSLAVTTPDFICPLNLMVINRFNPNLLHYGLNTIRMQNVQNNHSNNFGDIGLRSYTKSGNNLINPCVVANMQYQGVSGVSFDLSFTYIECCQ